MKNFEPFEWQKLQPAPVIGVDEVGRGCLAGRVYAAAVVLNSTEGENEFTDSKLLSAIRREKLAKLIQSKHLYGIGFASVEEIDEINILQASLLAMKRAVQKLGLKNGHLLVDGNQKIQGLENFKQTTLTKGDLRATPVGAASILAKVTRDNYMLDLAGRFPYYGFEKHKGYSTLFHKESIAKTGPCLEHRKSFAGVREHWSRLIKESL